MPHIVREEHIDDICANCKQALGEVDIELVSQGHKIYEIITCVSCGYKLIKLRQEIMFNDRFRPVKT